MMMSSSIWEILRYDSINLEEYIFIAKIIALEYIVECTLKNSEVNNFMTNSFFSLRLGILLAFKSYN